MLAEQQTMVVPERVTAVRLICRACEEERSEDEADHFCAMVDSSLRLEDRHGWATCRRGHRIELIRVSRIR